MKTYSLAAALAVISIPLPAAAADLPTGKTHENSIGMRLVRIDAGKFIQGQGESRPTSLDEWNERDWDESPAHPVRISQAFYLAAFEVTNAQYEKFDPQHKQFRGLRGTSQEDDHPVTYVTWQQATDFCQWLSEQEGLPYRLPTEAEWEYGCRAGTTTAFHTGDALTPEQANFGLAADGKQKISTRPVGSYPANPWGLHDMHGNVQEWCLDAYGPYAAGEQTDPVGRADGHARVARGWSYLGANHKLGTTRYCRSANRSGQMPQDANRVTGFRVVLGEMPKTRPLPAAEPPLNQRHVAQQPPPLKPRPDQPYFLDYAAEERAAQVPADAWGPVFHKWNHYSTVCVCPNGDVLAAWYTCVSESGRECAQAATRLRAGAEKWDPPSFFFGTPDVNTHAPVLLSDGKRIYHFATQSFHGWDDAADVMRYSDDSGATWSQPRIIITREQERTLSQPCSAYVAHDGTLVLACDGDFGHKDTRLVTSKDRGQTWQVRDGDLRKAAGGYAIHPAIVPTSDRATLVFLRGPKPLPAFLSRDLGDTWERRETPFPGISVGQKAAAVRLASGAILLVSHDADKSLFGGGTFAALSPDDGKTWPHRRKVPGPGGYLSAAQAADGTIYVVGPRRDSIRVSAFNEAWLKQ